jgi:hypothetical protein
MLLNRILQNLVLDRGRNRKTVAAVIRIPVLCATTATKKATVLRSAKLISVDTVGKMATSGTSARVAIVGKIRVLVLRPRRDLRQLNLRGRRRLLGPRRGRNQLVRE